MAIQIRESRDAGLVYREIGEFPKRLNRVLRHTWFDYGKALKKSADKAILAKPRRGRTYIIRGPSGRRRRHVASRGFESHANMTGQLRRSIGWKVFGHTEMLYGYGTSSAASNVAPDYAPYVEFGTVRMFERPSLANSIEAVSWDHIVLARLRVDFRDEG